MATRRFLIASVTAFIVLLLEFHSGKCKTLTNKLEISQVPVKERKLDNFVEFTGEGDQLAVESSVSALSSDKKQNNNQLLGHHAISSASSARQCSNVQKAVYPIIPVIIAFVVGLVGAIIISAIIRLVVGLKSESNDDSGYGVAGYSRRVGKKTLFGFDVNNINFIRLAKNVVSAIEETY